MSQQLFRRRWRVTVGNVQFTGLRIQFRAEKSLSAEPNKLDLTVSNLAEETRKKLQTSSVPVLLEAGYGDKTEQIFSGDCRYIAHTRAGTEWNTRVQSGDGETAFRTARINESFGPGVNPKEIVKRAMETMGLEMRDAVAKVMAGDWKTAGEMLLGGQVASGKSHLVLTDMLESAGCSWSIQDGAIQVLGRDETSDDLAFVLGPRTGLVGSPEMGDSGFVKLKCLLIGAIRPGRRIVLDSKQFQGEFRAERVVHHGDSHGQEWSTEVEARAL